MTEDRIQAMCGVLVAQRNSGLDMVAQMAGEIADYKARIAALEAKVVAMAAKLAPETPEGEAT